jgi:hypothetical protein
VHVPPVIRRSRMGFGQAQHPRLIVDLYLFCIYYNVSDSLVDVKYDSIYAKGCHIASLEVRNTPRRGVGGPGGIQMHKPIESPLKVVVAALVGIVLAFAGRDLQAAEGQVQSSPVPLLEKDHPVNWWFAFKFNSKSFPACRSNAVRHCLFGGTEQNYSLFSQQFVLASSEDATLKEGSGCAGDTVADPIGATFDEIYNGSFYYAIWNDQFYDDPKIQGCSKECGAPWGHSKGLIAWNDVGEGLVLQVTTPSWPAAGSRSHPRMSDGNTLGCVKDDNVEVSQHFFALKLSKDDLFQVLAGLENASVVTDPSNPQIVHNGGPPEIQTLVNALGHRSSSTTYMKARLSSGVTMISKSSQLHVPPWQMISALLNGVGLRTATWWANPKIPSTAVSTAVDCWDRALGKPGPVEIATGGQWAGTVFGLTGGLGPNFNHAKIGITISGDQQLAILESDSLGLNRLGIPEAAAL